MTTQRRRGPSARRAVWAGGMLVLLAGLLGMHGLGMQGLGSHGTAGMGPMAEASLPESVMGVGGAVHTSMSGVAHEAGSAVASTVVVAGHRLMDMGMAGMCVAILSIALIALLRLLSTCRVQSGLWVFARPARALSQVGRRPDAPSLFRLSIQRC